MLPTPPSSEFLKKDDPSEVSSIKLPEPLIGTGTQRVAGVGKRRQTHSEIERRRRNKLNEKFDELRELIPSCADYRFAKRGGDSGLHKLDILTEAVDYIRSLHKDQLESSASSKEALVNNTVPNQSRADVTRISFLIN